MFKSPLSLPPGCQVTYKTSDRDVWENLAFNVSTVNENALCRIR